MCKKVVTVSILILLLNLLAIKINYLEFVMWVLERWLSNKVECLLFRGTGILVSTSLCDGSQLCITLAQEPGYSMLSSGLTVHIPHTYSVSQHACVHMPHTHTSSHMYMHSHTHIHTHTNKIKYFLKNHYLVGYVCVILFGFVPQLLE